SSGISTRTLARYSASSDRPSGLHRLPQRSSPRALAMNGLATGTGNADAWLALALVDGLTARRAMELVAACGGPEAVLGAGEATPGGLGLRGDVVVAMRGARALVAAERRAIAGQHAAVVTWDDAAYPAPLRTIADPPLALFVSGTLDAPGALAVAI